MNVAKLPTRQQLAILRIIQGAGEALYGLQIVARSEGAVAEGSVYVACGRMVEKGLLTSELDAEYPKSGGMKRRRYSLTEYGQSFCKE